MVVFIFLIKGKNHYFLVRFFVIVILKVSIALDICRGITFLHTCSILHYDIRCKNIMMTERLEPKITNFEHESLVTEETSNLDDLTKIVHWLAPEKLRSKRLEFSSVTRLS